MMRTILEAKSGRSLSSRPLQSEFQESYDYAKKLKLKTKTKKSI